MEFVVFARQIADMHSPWLKRPAQYFSSPVMIKSPLYFQAHHIFTPMHSFEVGQRWISLSEPELGLGIVTSTAHRRVEVSFPLVEENRLYSSDNIPLIRCLFAKDDVISSNSGEQFKVLDIRDEDDLRSYLVSEDRWLNEAALAANQGKVSPLDRLKAGQLGRFKWFELYRKMLQASVDHQGRRSMGFAGPKINLIPHQFDVANQILQMPLPRALLADEVGLGKTIEAGLVIHQLLVSNRAERILICVPASLTNQWLVEMKRKFNLDCTLVDDEFCAEQQGNNPFSQVQLALCNFDWLQHSQYMPAAIEAGWDMMVIDESHRLQWQSKAYQSALKLSQVSHGALLLTATPEQLGVESHFARLHLLDPTRFPDLEQFLSEEQQYGVVSNIVDLIELGGLENAIDEIRSLNDEKLLAKAQDALADSNLEADFIDWMVDRYGTGRMVYRNTRRSIQGFPTRHTEFYHLKETSSLEWLISWLPEQGPNKILLICQTAEDAQTIVDTVNEHTSVQAGAFHEHYSLIERDQIAANFVEPDGIQLLACSEIGGEGRNFQHAQHLILFDMPEHPDLVDQRIGRLDRIGQGDNIYIHIPVQSGTPEARLTALYHHGFEMFSQPNPAASPIFEAYLDKIDEMMVDSAFAESTILQCKEASRQLLNEIEQGRDRLLEQHSFSAERIEPLLTQIEELDNSQYSLATLMEEAFDIGHVETEETSSGNLIISPSENCPYSFTNSMRDEKATITYSREQAAMREDLEFLSWDHPWIRGLIDDVEAAGSGFTACALMSDNKFRNGQVLVESFFITQAEGPGRLELSRFFKPQIKHYVIGEDLKNLTQAVDMPDLRDNAQSIGKDMTKEIISMKLPQIEKAITLGERIAQHETAPLTDGAVKSMLSKTKSEISRYKSLEIAEGAYQIEIEALSNKARESAQLLSAAKPKLAGVCIWINYLQ